MARHSISRARASLALLAITCGYTVTTVRCESVAYHWVSRTLDNQPCLNTCKNGKCYVDSRLNTKACMRDELAGVPNYYTAQDRGALGHCLSNCGRFGGYDYDWCYTTEAYDWDYCNSVVKSNANAFGRTRYGQKCVDECSIYNYTPSRCHTANQEYVACAPPARVPPQSCRALFKSTGVSSRRAKRAPLDRLFSPGTCTALCRARYRDAPDGEVQRRIANAVAPGAYSNGVDIITTFPAGSPYRSVATTHALNANGVDVLMPLVVRATLRRPTAAPRVWDDVPPAATANVREMYDGQSAGIDTGHIVAFINGGTRDLFNFVGQTAATNRGPYKVIENFIKEWINSLGYVEFTVVVTYVGTRPSEFAVKLKFFNDDGSVHSDCQDMIISNT